MRRKLEMRHHHPETVGGGVQCSPPPVTEKGGLMDRHSPTMLRSWNLSHHFRKACPISRGHS